MSKVITDTKNTKAMQRVDQAEMVKVFGSRMKAARELCAMTQVEAAKRLGYANSSKLAKIEGASDTSSIPLWIITKAAKLYDVSTDYLFGISDDWERDPVVSQQREIGRFLFETAQQSINAQVNAVRVLSNKQTALESVVSFSLKWAKEIKTLVDFIVDKNPTDEHGEGGFDNILGGSKLLRLAEQITMESRLTEAEMRRYHVYMEAADKFANIKIRNPERELLKRNNKDIFEDQ